jgi:hypothetical protein
MSRIYAAYSIGALIGPGLATLPGIHAPFGAYVVLLLLYAPLADRADPRAQQMRPTSTGPVFCTGGTVRWSGRPRVR